MKIPKIMPKISVKIKLIISMTVILGMTIFAAWFMNKTFLPSYYQYSKVSMLADTFEKVNDTVNKDKKFIKYKKNISEKSKLQMDILSANSSINLYMFELYSFFWDISYKYDYPNETAMNEMQKESVKEKTRDYVLNLQIDNKKMLNGKELIRKKKQYSVYKVYDERIGSYYLELFGVLDSGSFVYERTNYQSMRENVEISNRFLGYIGIGAILIAGILMLFISNSFTKPIMQISDIAKRMAALDFDIKYPVKTQDEIGILGDSINILSETLEETISELKSANNELQKDIENKIQIDEVRKEFLSNVSHELKTPIALIQGYAEGLQDNINDDSESRDFYCEVIVDEAKKMNKMVKKLLTLNQIEFGKNQVSFERFDIVPLLQSVRQSAVLLANQKQAEIIMEEYPKEYVWADEYLVEDVVTNYISNAINHVDGAKKIYISMKKKEQVVRVSVFNTGKCIPEEDIENVWIKFYKVDKARTRAYGGSGIGLSIVKAIMDSMSQKYGVINHDDGVEFWFELDRQN